MRWSWEGAFNSPDLIPIFCYVSSTDETHGLCQTTQPCREPLFCWGFSVPLEQALPQSEHAGALVAPAGIFLWSLLLSPVVLLHLPSAPSWDVQRGSKGGRWRTLVWGSIKALRRWELGHFLQGSWASVGVQPSPLAKLHAAWTSFKFRKSEGSIYRHVLWSKPVVTLTICLQKYSSHQLDPSCKFSCLPSPAGCCCSNL